MRHTPAILSILLAGAAFAADDRVIEGSAPAGKAQRLEIEAGVGSIEVRVGGDDVVTWRVALEADPSVGSIFSRKRRGDEVRADLAKVEVLHDVGGDDFELALRVPARLDDDDFKERWTITVPARFNARAAIDVGDLKVHGVAGGVRASVDVGNIVLEVPRGEIEASVDVGGIEILSEAAPTGDIDLEADVGDVDLELDGRRIRNDHGYGPGASLRLSGDGGDRVRARADVGDIEVTLGKVAKR
jgi:hypothetical protein